MTPEEAFEKWWVKEYGESYGGFYGKTPSSKAFLAGIQYQEMNQINCLYDIRKAVGDPEGRLMQSELIERVKAIADALPVVLEELEGCEELLNSELGGGHSHQEMDEEKLWSEAVYQARKALKSVATEKEEA